MTNDNKLLSINELEEFIYFSDEQREFLKGYEFSYILQNYCDNSMETDDDCGHSITKIAVVENKGYGSIIDIGTISIETTTYINFDGLPTLFGNDESVSYYISSYNIDGFPSYNNKTTENIFNDNRKEVLDKLGILNDAEKWFSENQFKQEVVNCNDDVIKYIEDRFSEHIFCDKCHSIIHSSHWENHGLFRVCEMREIDDDSFEIEREYFSVRCPICGEDKEVDADEHYELDLVEVEPEPEPWDCPTTCVHCGKEVNIFEDDICPECGKRQNDLFGEINIPDFNISNLGFEESFKNLGPKACSICGKMFCEHRYTF